MGFLIEVGLNSALPIDPADAPNRFRIGEEILLSDAAAREAVCVQGWGASEPDGVWSVGHTGGLRVLLSEPSYEPLTVLMVGKPFNPPGHLQTIVVDYNGRNLGHGTIAGPGRQTLRVVPEWEDARQVAIRLRLSFPNRTSVKAAGLGGDTRDLAYKLERLVVLVEGAEPPPAFPSDEIVFDGLSERGLQAQVDRLQADVQALHRKLDQTAIMVASKLDALAGATGDAR